LLLWVIQLVERHTDLRTAMIWRGDSWIEILGYYYSFHDFGSTGVMDSERKSVISLGWVTFDFLSKRNATFWHTAGCVQFVAYMRTAVVTLGKLSPTVT